jgi:hypothetical protein
MKIQLDDVYLRVTNTENSDHFCQKGDLVMVTTIFPQDEIREEYYMGSVLTNEDEYCLRNDEDEDWVKVELTPLEKVVYGLA